MNWTDVKVGDTVTVKTKGVTLTGPVVRLWGTQTDVTQLTVGDITVYPYLSKLIERKPGFKDGDIGLHTDPLTKATYVGVYSDSKKAFMDSTYRAAGMVFYPYYKGIKIIGNIHEEDDTWT